MAIWYKNLFISSGASEDSELMDQTPDRGFFVANIWELMSMQGISSASAVIFLRTFQP